MSTAQTGSSVSSERHDANTETRLGKRTYSEMPARIRSRACTPTRSKRERTVRLYRIGHGGTTRRLPVRGSVIFLP
jgi:hypothetical protein